MHISWEELVQKINIFEKKLFKNYYDEAIDAFFIEIKEIFENNKFEKWQIIEVRDRLSKMQTITEEIRLSLTKQKLAFTNNRLQHQTYLQKSK